MVEAVATRVDSCYSHARLAALAGACFLLLCLRRPDALVNAQLVAEDGVVFFREQLYQGVKALATPYNGYLHLLPRLVALLCSPLPVRWIPLGYNLVGGLVTSVATAAFFAPSSRFLLRSDGLRALVCLIVVSVGPQEVLLNNFNMQWALLALGALILAHAWQGGDRMPVGKTVVYAFAALLIGLTTPLLALISVPAGLCALRRRRGRQQWVVAAMLAAALVQILTLTAAARSTTAPVAAREPALVLGARVGYATLVSIVFRVAAEAGPGLPVAHALARWPSLAVLATGGPVLLVALAWLLAHSDRTLRLHIVAAVLLAAASVAAPLVLRDYMLYFKSYRGSFYFWGGGRYFVLATGVFVWLVALVVERSYPVGLRKYVVLPLLFAGALVLNFRAEPYPNYHWETLAPKVEGWRQTRAAGRQAERVVIPIPPEGWSFALE